MDIHAPSWATAGPATRPPAIPMPNAINVNQAVNVHLMWTPFRSPDMMSEEAKDVGIY